VCALFCFPGVFFWPCARVYTSRRGAHVWRRGLVDRLLPRPVRKKKKKKIKKERNDARERDRVSTSSAYHHNVDFAEEFPVQLFQHQ
jgi:hypothetical protein